MSTCLGQIEGAVLYRIIDLNLVLEIEALLKKHNNANVQPDRPKLHENGNGRAKNPETKEKVLQLLKEKYSSNPFTVADAKPMVKSALGVGEMTIRRSLRAGVEKGILEANSKGVYHFLELALTPRSAGSNNGK
jgi:hypothetical protein